MGIKFPPNILMNVDIFQQPLIVSKQYSVALNGFQAVVEGFPGLLFAEVFYRSRSNVKMNVKRPISGLGASLSLNFSKFPQNILMNVGIFQQHLMVSKQCRRLSWNALRVSFLSIAIECENERETAN